MKLNYNVNAEELKPHNNAGIRKECADLIRGFLASGMPAAKIEADAPRVTVYGRFANAIRNEGLSGCKVITRGNDLFLVRG